MRINNILKRIAMPIANRFFHNPFRGSYMVISKPDKIPTLRELPTMEVYAGPSIIIQEPKVNAIVLSKEEIQRMDMLANIGSTIVSRD